MFSQASIKLQALRRTLNAGGLLTRAMWPATLPAVQTASFSRSSVAGSDKKWKVGKLNHVAIAVPNMEDSIHFYRNILGAVVSEVHPQPEHGVYTAFVELGDTKIELLLPYGDNSPIAKFLEKNKAGGIHHICLEVNDIEKAMSDLRAEGIRTLGETTKIGAHGKPVIFLHPKDCNGVLTELEEHPEELNVDIYTED